MDDQAHSRTEIDGPDLSADPDLPAVRESLDHDATALRQDLTKEYFALVDIVSGFDGRVMTVKGWSVTLSLAGLGLGFQQGHFALFALAATTALSFWIVEGQMKTQQWRYYSRMRDIEIAHYHLNRIPISGLGEFSALRIDQQWGYKGGYPDWRNDSPWRRKPEEIRRFLYRPLVAPHVFLPHALAVVVGLTLFVAAWLGLWHTVP